MKPIEHGILSTLPERTRTELMALGTVQTRAKGEILFDEVENLGTIYFLLEGYAALYRSSFQGDKRVIFVCAAGEVLNELCLEQSKSSVAAKTLSEAKLLCVPCEHVEAMMQRDADFARILFHSVAQKTRRLYHKVGNASGTYPLKNHLAANLWKLARSCGVECPEGVTFDFEITVNFLSDMMGAKRETVSRALSDMKRSGLLTHENGTLTILNMQRLRDSVGE